ncbi:hypothetical protein Pcinc_004868 [Petrolisthes cinctipes]|uniref:Ras-related protein Rab-18 n=1 Tax=Petrolisthes cinctipes TaxID=88211 RepID=A0AAE1GG74_PETCI|nr:hypothetical protein Pcinc_004868 [Petrolisthes cinctipes]
MTDKELPVKTFKVLVLGESGVGKSSLLLRLTDGIFDEEHHSTIGFDYKDWLRELEAYTNSNDVVVKMIVGNKSDLKHIDQVNKEDVLTYARRHAMLYTVTSAKTNEGVQCAFQELVLKIIQTPSLWLEDNEPFHVTNTVEDKQLYWSSECRPKSHHDKLVYKKP